MTNKNINSSDIENMLNLINNCIKSNKLEFLANVILKLQKEYIEICELSTDGEFKPDWTHEKVLNYLSCLDR